MRINPEAIAFREPEGGWRDDEAARYFAELLRSYLRLAQAGIAPPLSPLAERLRAAIAARVRS